MKSQVFRGLAGFCLAAAMIAPAGAVDTVARKSTTTPVAGEITGFTKTEVTVKPRTGDPVAIPVNDIASVSWDADPTGLNLARAAEKAGRLGDALDRYQKALSEAGASPNVKGDLEFLIARVTAKTALADPAKLDEAIKKLEDFRKANAAHFRYYETLDLLGRVYMAKKDFTNAKLAFDLLGQAPWSDYKMAAQTASARLLLLNDDVAGALAGFNAVIAMPAQGPAEMSQRYEAMLGKATCLQEQKQFAEAVTVLEEVIEQVPVEDSRVQAEAYLRQGDCLREQGKPKEALLAYLHVDVLFPGETSLHAEALYHLSRLWNTVERPDRADDARNKLVSQYPNSDWAKKLEAGG